MCLLTGARFLGLVGLRTGALGRTTIGGGGYITTGGTYGTNGGSVHGICGGYTPGGLTYGGGYLLPAVSYGGTHRLLVDPSVVELILHLSCRRSLAPSCFCGDLLLVSLNYRQQFDTN